MSHYGLPPLDPQKGSWDDEALSRRRFLELGFWSAAGVAGLTVGGAGLRFLAGNSLDPKPEHWVEVGAVADLPTGQVHRATYKVRTTDVWREIEKAGLLYAFSDDGAEYTVLEATCSHLGCNVHWREETGHFACPCHNGAFTREGVVVSGPPPAPLRRLSTKIENGILLALV
ncbi:MAG: Rieske (2Fe-2S) protein [Anaerolineae bacterium]|nr:Rieske (2Fe-2S) protein [Anaerolineae bacterium]